MAHRPLRFLVRPLAAVFLACLGACGQTASHGDYVPFEANYPTLPPHDPITPPAPTVPPPYLPSTPVFRPDAFPHDRTALFGSFPSDAVLFDDTVFTSDADQIEGGGALVVPVDVSGPTPVRSTRYTPCTVFASTLIDSAGNPGNVLAPIGFGFYLNEILVVDSGLGFVLANAGGSDSSPTLSDVVAFDPTTGAVKQVVSLANRVTSANGFLDSSGAAVPGGSFVQSGAEGMEFVSTGPGVGRLYVAMSNLVFGAPSFGAVKEPGTIQVYDVLLSSPLPLAARPTAGVVTETHLCGGYNPVAIQAITPDGGSARDRLLVTVAGATGYDASGNLVPVTDASVEAYDGPTGAYLGAFRLGLAGLSAIRPAIGTDVAGHRVGFFPSATTGEVYLLRLDGLYGPDVDASRLAVLRGPTNGIPIAAAAAGGPGGNLTGVGLAPDGKTLVVAGFGDLFAYPTPKPGRLFLLSLPSDLVTGAGFGLSYVPGATEIATTPGRALGALVLVPNPGDRPDVYVNVSGSIDTTTFLGSGPASLGALRTFGVIR